MIRQQGRQITSHWQGALAHPTIAAVNPVLFATIAIGAEKNYAAVFEEAFNITMPAAWS